MANNIGYDLNAAAGKCFLHMLNSSDWYSAATLTAGSDPKAIFNQLAAWAIMAAQSIEATINANISKY